LSLEIRDIVELLPYRDFNDLLQLCIRVEQQNLRKNSFKKENAHSISHPKKNYPQEETY